MFNGMKWSNNFQCIRYNSEKVRFMSGSSTVRTLLNVPNVVKCLKKNKCYPLYTRNFKPYFFKNNGLILYCKSCETPLWINMVKFLTLSFGFSRGENDSDFKWKNVIG